MSQLVISEVAERHLDQWANALQRGELQVWQLPGSVQQFVSIGWVDGMTQARQQTAEYEHRLDIAYLQAYSPKERREEYQRRLDTHFQLEEAAFYAAADGTTENDFLAQGLQANRAA